MIRIGRSIGLLALTVTLLACGDPTGVEPITQLPRSLSQAEVEVVGASNAFAFGLLRETRAANPTHNTFLSPLSVSMALGMTMNGADGETWRQMRDMLGFGDLEEPAINSAYQSLIDLLLDLDPDVEVGVGNSLWPQEGFELLPDFVDRVTTHFDATVMPLDFADPGSVDVMNDWVAAVTNGRIDSLVEEIPDQAVLFLLNAIYFNGDWRTTFDPDGTADATFTRSDGSTVTVSMMSDEVGYRLLTAGGPSGVRGVELPYGGGAFAAVALLPPQEMGIDEFVAGLDDVAWQGWMSQFDGMAETEDLDEEGILVELPKFELEWDDTLKPALQALGMTDAFVDRRADLSRISGDPRLFVMDVVHNTFVKLDEEGTEAAAATSVDVGVTSAGPSLRFDRPFVFAIRERYSGAILFIGVIGDPRG